jgi:hypothetical protein
MAFLGGVRGGQFPENYQLVYVIDGARVYEGEGNHQKCRLNGKTRMETNDGENQPGKQRINKIGNAHQEQKVSMVLFFQRDAGGLENDDQSHKRRG